MYFVGGPNTVRGYEEFPNSFANGRAQAIFNLEYRFLFNQMISSVVIR